MLQVCKVTTNKRSADLRGPSLTSERCWSCHVCSLKKNGSVARKNTKENRQPRRCVLCSWMLFRMVPIPPQKHHVIEMILLGDIWECFYFYQSSFKTMEQPTRINQQNCKQEHNCRGASKYQLACTAPYDRGAFSSCERNLFLVVMWASNVACNPETYHENRPPKNEKFPIQNHHSRFHPIKTAFSLFLWVIGTR